jgi:hypothetical protein
MRSRREPSADCAWECGASGVIEPSAARLCWCWVWMMLSLRRASMLEPNRDETNAWWLLPTPLLPKPLPLPTPHVLDGSPLAEPPFRLD